MRATTKTRAQRRLEKKHTIMLVVLVVSVAVISFALGVVVGRNTAEPTIVQQVMAPQRIAVAEPPVPIVPEIVSDKPEEEKLTFYENLSKGETVPIGSGINLAPAAEPAQPVDEVKEQVAVVEPALAPATAISSPVAAPDPVSQVAAVSERLPQVAKGGDWVVQIFSSKSAADAGLLRDELNGKGYPAFIAEADLGDKGIWYRVHLGPYLAKDAATRVQIHVEKKDKFKGFVKRR